MRMRAIASIPGRVAGIEASVQSHDLFLIIPYTLILTNQTHMEKRNIEN